MHPPAPRDQGGKARAGGCSGTLPSAPWVRGPRERGALCPSPAPPRRNNGPPLALLAFINNSVQVFRDQMVYRHFAFISAPLHLLFILFFLFFCAFFFFSPFFTKTSCSY